MPKIKTLTVECLRGIIDTTLSPEGRSIVLLGENGSGKSSFVDALEFFFSGQMSHLEGAQAISTIKHGPHISHTRNDTLVAIEFDNPNAQVSRTFRGLSKTTLGLADFIELGAGCSFILRRKNLLDFILAQPAPRYQQLGAIIGVDDLDKIERALMQARDDLLSQKDSLGRQILSEEKKLNDLLVEEARNDEQILVALNRRLSLLDQSPLTSLDEIEDRKIAAVTASRSPEDTQRAVKVQSVLTLVTSLRDGMFFLEEYRHLSDEVGDLQHNAARVREMLFQEVLASSLRLIADYGLDYCPVCLRPVDDRQELLASLEKRVRDAEEIARKASEIKRLRSRLADRIRDRLRQVQPLASQVTELQTALNEQTLARYSELLNNILLVLQADPADMHLPTPDDLRQAPALEEWEQGMEGLKGVLKSEKQRLEPTEQDKLAVQVIGLLTRVKDSRQELITLRPQWRVKAATCQEMADIFECFVRTKRTQVQGIYRELEGDIERFFKLLHSDEGYRGVKLEVKEGRRASTEIKMDFHDREEEDPRAFNSEGHLDSLGLCIFLAFVKRFNAGFPLMVLDDVVSSIDAGHRQRICELIFQEFSDYQLFITTHDYVWFEELRAHQRAFKRDHLCLNLQILDWSLDAGPRLDRYKPRWERVEEKLAGGDKEGAAADARKALEAFLYEMAITTRTPVTLNRDSRYVISDLHGPFVSRIKKLAPNIYSDNLALFQDLEKNTIFGNLLVHNNPRAAGASLNEVRGFVNAVRNLEDLFTCSQCGRHVEYHQSAKIIKCRCKSGGILWMTGE